MELPADVAAAYDEVARGRRIAVVERERRIGRIYVLLGCVFFLTIMLGAMALRGPAWPVGAIVLVIVAAYVLRQRWLRHMKVDARGFTGLPPGGVTILFLSFFLIGPIFKLTGIPYDGWSIQLTLFGGAIFVGGLLRKDRLHAILGLGTIALAAALFASSPTPERAAAISGLTLGGALVGLGLVRYFTPPVSAP